MSPTSPPGQPGVIPAAFVLAAWANAWLAGSVSLDDVIDALRRLSGDADLGVAHHIYAADQAALLVLDTADAAPLTITLGRLRSVGATSFALALPGPGDPLGLGGPRAFTESATSAGQAVLCEGLGLGLVPHAVGAGIQWALSQAHPGSAESLAEADERLARAIAGARQHVTGADAGADARGAWQPAARDRDRAAATAAGSVRRRVAAATVALPSNAPARAERVLTRSVTCLQIEAYAASRALDGDQVAPTDLVRELSAAGRRGLVAAVRACRGPTGDDR